jgi:hypothetical protein
MAVAHQIAATPPPAPAWLDELALQPGPPWLSMGVRTLELEEWLISDGRFDEELALKELLLATRPHEVFAALAGCEEASDEILELIQAWRAAHPQEGHAASPRADLHPLDAAGRLVQEDLCVMVESDGRYRLEAASLCFPSHWRLHDKLGHSLATIHDPVPHYAEELAAKVDTFFDRLRADRPVQRRNLSIHNHDELFRPGPHESPGSFAPDPSGVDQVWLRSERQTLVRLARTGAVLFTIKTQQCPVVALAGRPDIAAALAVKLRAEQDDLLRAGRTVPFPLWLVGWLEMCRGEPERERERARA